MFLLAKRRVVGASVGTSRFFRGYPKKKGTNHQREKDRAKKLSSRRGF